MSRSAKTLQFDGVGPLPTSVSVHVEVPRGSYIKRNAHGSIDFISPLRCPFNYGSIRSIPGADGEPLDAVVLGPPLALNTEIRAQVRGVVAFVDAGIDDPKVVCCPRPLSPSQCGEIERFFVRYARAKRLVRYLLRGGRAAATFTDGWCALRHGELSP